MLLIPTPAIVYHVCDDVLVGIQELIAKEKNCRAEIRAVILSSARYS
jgi:hypothetical protein